MSMQSAIVAIKTANSTLNTLVGTRFHPNAIKQTETLPAMCFNEISRMELDWSFYGRPHICRIRVQVDGYASSSINRTALRTAFINCFLPANAARVSGSYGGETVLDIRADYGADSIEKMDTLAEVYRFRRDLICDFRMSSSL